MAALELHYDDAILMKFHDIFSEFQRNNKLPNSSELRHISSLHAKGRCCLKYNANEYLMFKNNATNSLLAVDY